MNTKLDRRNFIRTLFGGALSAGLGIRFSPEMVFAQGLPNGLSKNLVIVDLSGGLDGLYAFPYIQSDLAAAINARRSPLVPSGTIPVTSVLGLHPNWAPLLSVYDQGKIRILQKVGFPGSFQGSHDLASSRVKVLDPFASGSSQGFGHRMKINYPEKFGDLSMWGFRGSGKLFKPDGKAMEVETLASYSYQSGPFSSSESSALRQAAIDMLYLPTEPTLDSAARQELIKVAKQSHAAVAPIANIRAIPLSGNYGSTNFANNMRDIVRIVKNNYMQSTNLSTFCYVKRGGFDSHGDELATIPNAITDLANALTGAASDLQSTPEIWNNTVIVVVSEFGRTISSNTDSSNAGTDHGFGNTTFVMGGSVVGGLAGETPLANEFSNPANKVLSPTMDFRSIFHEITSWMGMNTALIIPGYSLPSNPVIKPNLFS